MPFSDEALRTLLAEAFPDVGTAKLLVSDAGLSRAYIESSGPAQVFWQAILEEAWKTGKLDELLARAAKQAPVLEVRLNGRRAYYRWLSGHGFIENPFAGLWNADVGLEIFVPAEGAAQALPAFGANTPRATEEPINWGLASLEEMLNQRLAFFSTGQTEKAGSLFTAAGWDLPRQMLQACDNNPQSLLKLYQELLRVHLERAGQLLFDSVDVSTVLAASRDARHPALPVEVKSVLPKFYLELVVTMKDLAGAGVELQYRLHSPEGLCHHEACGSMPLKDVSTYREQLHIELEQLIHGRDVHGSELLPDEAEVVLQGVGEELYRRLFTPGLKAEFKRIHSEALSAGLSSGATPCIALQITTEDPWIPWELVRPCDGVLELGYLCTAFELTRWLSGAQGGAREIRLDTLKCIEAGHIPGRRELRHATEEQRLLRNFALNHSINHIEYETAHQRAVLNDLRTQHVSLWHFIAHGHLSSTGTPRASMLMGDGHHLDERDLHQPKIIKRIQEDRPLFFLNACQTGAEDWLLMGSSVGRRAWSGKLTAGRSWRPCGMSRTNWPMFSPARSELHWKMGRRFHGPYGRRARRFASRRPATPPGWHTACTRPPMPGSRSLLKGLVSWHRTCYNCDINVTGRYDVRA
jgi:hypothetical protein